MHSRFPVATALIDSFRDGYSLSTAKSDFGAALVVSLIALPLSMALAIAVGLPPQHGLYTAIIAGAITAILGGSKFQVTGPTAAFVAILAPIVTQHGITGLIWCQLMAGTALIVMGFFKLGRFIALVPYSVTMGFTAGIAVVIATLSLNDLFGMHIAQMGDHYWDKVISLLSNIGNVTVSELIIGFVSLTIMMFLPRCTKAVPAPVVGIAIGTILSMFAVDMGIAVDTIASRFTYIAPDGSTGSGIPPYLPQFQIPVATDLWPLIVPAITVALLAALESLLAATVADNITETKHNPNAELVGVGIGNLVSGFFAGIPATGALSRTAANIHAGAKTPMASSVHTVFLLAYMILFAKYLSAIPMASLAALLLITAWRMAQVKIVMDIIRVGNKQDLALLGVTFFLTAIFDMVVGVAAGLGVAYILHLRNARIS